ncbi:kinase-like protein [Thelephora ganbajun]|uniref:Kinase-like protein n=1 Tax=Thelephora ganbajun TaxID=370292 RepID=A0ACB6Z7S1_THEGA|nr:kinase-like protein [Thelephora ganbajun]
MVLVELFDKVASSTTVNQGLRDRCLRDLREISATCCVLPRSYFSPSVTLSDTTPHTMGELVDIWKAQLNGNQVCIKSFRTQTAKNLDKIKRRFYHEIIGWKYVSHPNVLPFLGVSETLFPFCIITPWLPNGNIVEYTRKNIQANRLRLLAQAAYGLEYLHSLSIVHGDINPGNILITEDGIARVGDFGITGVITDPTVVDPGSTTRSKPGAVRYMAPELLNPLQFNFSDSNPSKESDIYSLTMTAYETLAEILPYGDARDGIITFRVMTGDRPPRPLNARWLQDQIWNMIQTCWSEKREQRWDAHAIYSQFSVSSIQEIAEVERDVRTIIRTLKVIADALPEDLPAMSLSVQEISARAVNQPGQRLINSVDKMLEDGNISSRDKPGCLNILGKMCRRLRTIPDSMRIESCLGGPTGEEYGGGFATVSRGECRGRAVAIKTLHLYVTSNFEERFSEFRREVIAWRHLQHPNILPFIGVNLERQRLAMVSEWMEHGKITEFVEKHKEVNRIQLVKANVIDPFSWSMPRMGWSTCTAFTWCTGT